MHRNVGWFALVALAVAGLAAAALAPRAHAQLLISDFQLGAQWKINSAARLMAGLAPWYPGHFEYAQTGEWKQHSATMSAVWDELRSGRVSSMNAWRDREVSRSCPVGKTLLYPFSGPDFFNAYWLFPECRTFVMFGLEHIGKIPDLERTGKRDLTNLMSDVRTATADLFHRNYFITSNMSRQLFTAQLRGVVPLIAISMALSGVEILRITPQTLNRYRQQATRPSETDARKLHSLRVPRGVEIEFRMPGSREVKRLIYFSVDATNSSLTKYPEFLAFLRDFGPTTTLVKAASYLLHDRNFSKLRAALLEVSHFLVQDDSGVPYNMLVRDAWDVQLHGTYSVPIPPFQRAFQPALKAAYEKQPFRPLSFDFGYHFHDRREGRAMVMVGRKRAEHKPVAALAHDGLSAKLKFSYR